MLLGRFCANTTKVAHLLRAHGCHISPKLLDRFDESTAAFVSRVLGGDFHKKALEQAALGLNYGGLGFRKADILAAPSHLASLVEARPCVAHLLRLASDTGIKLPSACSICESNVTRAQKDFITRLDPRKGHLLEIFCNDAAEKAAERFNDILSGTGPAAPNSPVATGRSGDHVLITPEETDPEIPRAVKPIKLQHDLSVLFDQDGHDHLTADFKAQLNSGCDFQRFKDLRDETVSSKWLWTVDPRSRLTLDSKAHIAATRLRLGARFTCQPIRCRLCNRTLDIKSSHA